MNRIRKEKGITLIALGIMIVVLIVLTAVAIGEIGDNGVLKRSRRVISQHEEYKEGEKEKVQELISETKNDNDKPVNEKVLAISPSTREWTNKDIVVTSKAFDMKSGEDIYIKKGESGTWQKATETTIKASEYTGPVEVFAGIVINNENTNNPYYQVSTTIDNIDTIKPTDTAPNLNTTKDRINVTCKQEDFQSKIDESKTLYAIREKGTDQWSNWQSDREFENLKHNTYYEVKTKATDKAGNEQESQISTAVTRLEYNNPTDTEPTGLTTTCTITVIVQQEDPGSGIDETKTRYAIRKEGDTEWSEWQSDNVFTDLDDDTTYEIKTKVTDNSDNEQESKVARVKTDELLPGTLNLRLDDENGDEYTSGDTTSHDVYVELVEGNGTTTTYASYGNSAQTINSTSGTTTVDTEGTTYIRITATDGHNTATADYTIIIDKTAPKAIIYGGATVVKNNLLRYYDGENNIGNGHDNSATQWTDLSENQNANLSNVTFDSGGFANFNGSSSWANLGQITNQTNVTIDTELRINAVQSGEREIVCNYESGGFGLSLLDGVPEFVVYTNTYHYFKAKDTLIPNKNYHITGTYDGSRAKLYIDGVLCVDEPLTGSIKDPTSNTVMIIGANPGGSTARGNYTNMKLYAARIYSSALTQAQIKQNMNGDRIRTSSISTSDASVTLSIVTDMPVTDLTADDFTVTYGTKGTFTKISDTEYTLAITGISGSKTLKVTLANTYTDLAGNRGNSFTIERYRDVSAPSGTITSDVTSTPTNVDTITYTITFHEDVIEFTTEDITVTNGNKGTFTKVNARTYTLVVTGGNTGTQTISFPAGACFDLNGNLNAARSYSVQIDKTPPSAGTIANTPGTTTIDSVISGAEDESGIKEYDYYIDGNKVGTSEDPTYQFTGLTPNTEHTIQYIVRDNAGNETTSDEVIVYTLATVPTISVTGGATAQGKQITITLGANSNPANTTYEIYCVTDSAVVYTGTDLSFVKTGLGTNVTKKYKVRAKNHADVYTDYSSEATGNTLASPTVTKSVTSNGVNSGTNNISLSWNSVPGAAGYGISVFDGKVYRNYNLGNVTSWDSNTANIYPTAEQITSWNGTSDPFRWSGDGQDWKASSNEMYLKANGNYKTYSYYEWIHVYSYDSASRVSGTANNGARSVAGATEDSDAPNQFTPTASQNSSNSVTITGSTTDQYMTAKNPGSGIRGYKFGIYKNGNWEWSDEQSGTSYTFAGLTQSTSYPVKMQAYDNRGNYIETTANVTGSTTAVPDISGDITWTYSTLEWTKENVTATASTSISGYTLQTSQTSPTSGFEDTASQTRTTNGNVYARLWDGTNYGATATGSINNIDKTAPTITSWEITNLSESGYDVYVYGVNDTQSGVNKVLFPTWTNSNGQDDLEQPWRTNGEYLGENLGNGTWHFRVNISDHNYESGTYTTHIYTFDNVGNEKKVGSSANNQVPAVKVTYDYNLDTTIPSGEYFDTGFAINWDKNFKLETTVNISELGKRYLVFGGYQGGAYTKELNIEITNANKLRVYYGVGGHDKTAGTFNAGEDVNVTFIWDASTKTYEITARGTTTNITMSNTVDTTSQHDPNGITEHTLRMGCADYRGNTTTFNPITIKAVKITNDYTSHTALTDLPIAVREGYSFTGWSTSLNGGTPVTNETTVPDNNVTYYANWLDNIAPTITAATPSGTWDIENFVDFDANDKGTGINAYAITTSNTAPTEWIPVISTVEEHTETKRELNAAWARVFHQNTHYGEVYYTDADEATSFDSSETVDKYSVLGSLNNYKNNNNIFEFLLQYPLRSTTLYNRWKQNDNPVTLEIANTSAGQQVPGYESVHTDWTGSKWGGLARNLSNSSLLDGEPGHTYWNFAIGVYSRYKGSMPGPHTGSATYESVANLWSRIDEKTPSVEANLTRRLGDLRENRTYYVWVKDANGNSSSRQVTTNRVDITKPTASITSTNNIAASQTATLSIGDNIGAVSYFWGTSNPITNNVNWTPITSTTSTTVEKDVVNNGTYYLGVKDAAGNVTVTSKAFYKTTLTPGRGTVTPTTIITMAGNTVDLPNATAIGATFTGWYTAATDGTKQNTSYTPTGNATLYGHWSVANYQLSYNLNDGTTAIDNPEGYTIDSSDITLNNPTKVGYNFDGWTEKIKNLTWSSGFVDVNTGLPVSDPTYPDSHYTDFISLRSGEKYTITELGSYNGSNIRWRVYNTSGTYLGNKSSSATYTATSDCYVRIVMYQATTEELRNGIIVNNDTAASTTERILHGSAGNREYTANWTAKTITATYNANGGTVSPSSKEVTYNSTYGTLETPSKSGYTFKGWSYLPEGYTQLQYIEATGTQYINSGYKPGPNTGVEATYQFTSITPVQQRIYGIQGANTNASSFTYTYYINGSSKMAYAFKNGTGNWVGTGIAANTSKHTFSLNVNKGYWKYDNQENKKMAEATATNTALYDMFILAATTNGTTVANNDHRGIAKLYSLNIYENGNIVRQYVPCKNSNGEVGLYEVYQGTFYGNIGTGTFTEGPVEYVTDATTVSIPDNHTLYAKYADETAPTAPTVTAKLTNASGAAYTEGEWTNKDIYVQLDSTETGSGIKEFQWYENGAWTTRALTTEGNSASITYTVNRNETIRYRAIDNANNISDEATLSVKIDKTKPTITASNITYGQNLSITLKDSASKVVAWQVTNSSTTPTSGWTNISETENTTVTKSGLTAGTKYIWAKDKAGNIQSKSITVNKAEMTLTSGNYTGPYDTSSHSITLNVTTPSSGSQAYYSTTTELTSSNYSSAGSTTKPTRTDAGTTTVYWYVKSNNANYNDKSGSNTITIDPSTTLMAYVDGDYSGVYDGSSHQITLEVTNPTGCTLYYSTSTALTSSNYTTAGTTTAPTRTIVGTTTVYWYIKSGSPNFADKSGSNTITISKQTVDAPTNINITTGGIVTWTASSNATSYEISTSASSGFTNIGNVTSYNYLSTIIGSAGSRTVYVRAVNSDTTNYTSPSSNVSKAVTVRTITFSSNNTTMGTLDTASYNVISGATVSATNNTLTVKGKNASNADVNLKTVTATPNTGYEFSSWSKTSGSITANTTITATFASKILNITLDINGGNDQGTGTIYEKYNTGYYLDSACTTQMTSSLNLITPPSRTGYTFAGYYTSSSGGTQYIDNAGKITSSASTTNFTENGTLYAHWTANTNTAYVVNHYVHNYGTDTYTLNSTENKTGTSDSYVTLDNLKKTITGYTYLVGYANAGDTTKPSSGEVTETTILPDGSRVINLYYRPNYLYVQYDMNGGSMASNHGSEYSTVGSLICTTSGDTRYLRGFYGSKVGGVNTTTYATATTDGLHNYNSSGYINIVKSGYTAQVGAQWNTSANGTGTSYNQDTKSYNATAMATACGYDLGAGDVTVTLYVNWVAPNYGSYSGTTLKAYYPTLAEATSKATSGYTIKPLKTLTDGSTASPTIASGKTLTLDLNGFTVTMGQQISNAGNLTITGTGELTSTGFNTIVNTGTFTKSGESTISNTSTASYYVLNNTGTATLSDGNITSSYRAINNGTAGKLNISGATISSTTSNYAIENAGTSTGTSTPSIKMTSGIVQSAGDNAIQHTSSGHIYVTGGRITTTGTNAIYATSTGAITIGEAGSTSTTSPEITGRICGNATTSGDITINGGKVTATSSQAIYSTGNITITGGTINSSNGVGVYGTSGTVTIGTSDNTVNTIPTITGGTWGVQLTTGQLNFYDGSITGAINQSISKDPTQTTPGYEVKKTISGTTETAKLALSMTASSANYSSSYDGSAHTITGPNVTTPSSGYTVYYSTSTPLTYSNYSTAGTTTKPTRTNVGTTTVYWFVDSGSENYADKSGSNTISISKANMTTPSVSIDTDGKVTWGNVTGATSYQISFDNSTWTTATSGSQYIDKTSTGSKTAYVRAVSSDTTNYNTPSAVGQKSINVYSLTLNKDTGISSVSGAGNYVSGKVVSIDATVATGYTWNTWTKSSGTAPANATAKGTTVTIAANTVLQATSTAKSYLLSRINDNSNILSNGDFEEYSIVNAPTRTANGVTHSWDQELNGIPGNTSKAYNAPGWGTGANLGVQTSEIGYHAHMKMLDGNAVFDFKTNEDYEGMTQADVSGGITVGSNAAVATGRWLGISQGITPTKITAGKKYMMTVDMYRVSGSNYVTGGLHYAVGTSTSKSFKSGQCALSPSTTGQWETLSWTFTVDSTYNNAVTPSLYVYGNVGGAGEFYVDNVRLEEVTTETTTQKTYNTNYTSSELPSPTRTGYTFDGWYNNGSYTTRLSTSNKFTTSTASFEKVETAGTPAYIYAKWNANALTFDNQSIEKTYSTSAQTASITPASNGTGSYTYTEKSEKNSGGTSTNYISISGTTINISANTPAGTYTYVITAKDNGSHVTKDATYTIVIGKIKPTITLSPTSAAVTYNASATFTATVNSSVDCAGTLTATSGGTSYVSITGGASTNVTATNEGVATTITYKGVGYRNSGTAITVAFTPTDTTNFDSATSQTFNVTKVNSATMTVSSGNYSGTYDGSSHTITGPSVTTPSSGYTIYYSDTTALTSSNYNTAGSTTKPTKTSAGTTTVYWYIKSGNTNYADKSGSNTITISKQTVNPPTNVNVTTGGIVTWTASSNATSYEISTSASSGFTNIGNVTSYNYLSTIIGSTGSRTVYVRAVNSDTTNYTSPSSNGSKSVTVCQITFKPDNTIRGTVDTSTYNIISGATVRASSNTITVKGKNASSTDVDLVTVTATPNTGYEFNGWSTSAGSITTDTSITAYFSGKLYTVSLDINGGTTQETSTIYERYSIGYYIGSEGTGLMSTSANPITIPTRVGYTFAGYYTAASGGTQYINQNGYLTSSANNKYFTNNGTLYAHWTANTNTPYIVNHYTHNYGSDTYTLNSTEDKTGTSDSTLTLENLKKTITGFTYLEGYVNSGDTTKPSSGQVTETTVLPDGTRVINLYYRPNLLYVQYDMNGGSMATNHGAAYSTSGSLICTTSGETRYLRGFYGSKVGGVNTTTYATATTDGLHDYQNTKGINIVKDNCLAQVGAQWNTRADGTGTSYNQATKTYNATAMATACGYDLGAGDVVVTLYVNWVETNYGSYSGTTLKAYYATLADATAKATSGYTIKPLKTLTDGSTASPTLASGRTLTLDLNGFTVTMGQQISNAGNLTITGTGELTSTGFNTIVNTGTFTKSGESTISNTSTASYYVLNNTGTATLSAGTITSGYKVVNNGAAGKLNITGATISATTSNVAIDNAGTSTGTSTPAIKMTGGTVQSAGNYAIQHASAGHVYITGGTVTTTGTTAIYGTTASTGPITIGEAGSTSTTSPEITGRICGDSTTAGDITINGGKVTATSTQAVYSKASIYINGGDISATSSYAVYPGGGATSKARITGGTITSKSNSYAVTTANTSGGIIEITGGTISKTTGTNPAVNNQKGTTTITGGTINSSKGSGVYATSGTVTIGDDDGTVNTTPTITGATYGVQVTSGPFYFYDGSITGKTNQSINKNPTQTAPGYEVKKTISGTTETATLALPMTVSASNYNNSYDGSSHSITGPNVTTPSSGYTVYYSETTELTYSNYSTAGTTTKPTATNAGTTTVYWYVESGSANYNDKAGSNTITIEKITPTIALSPTSAAVTYNATGTFTATTTSSINCAGTLTATSNGTSYVSITGGATNSVTATSTGVGKTITYKGVGYTNSGTTITVAFTPSDTTNFNSATSQTFTISKVNSATMTVSSGNYSGTYDGSSHTITGPNVTTPSSGYTIYYSDTTALTSSNYTTAGSTEKPSKINVGTTTVYWYVKSNNSNYADKSGSNTITITKQTVNAPTSVNVTTAGYVTWTASSNANAYEISIDNTNWETATSGVNYLDKIIASTGSRTVYVRGKNTDTTNYTSPSSNATKAVTVRTITFSSNNATMGTLDTASYKVISGATVSANGDTLTVKGKNASNADVDLKTVIATPKTEYDFISWSKTSGSITANTTITATFAKVYLRTSESNVSATSNYLGSTISRDTIKKISFATSIEGHTVDGSTCWDVSSETNSQKVLMWIESGNATDGYEIVIGQNGGVRANPSSYNLFAYIGSSLVPEINLANLKTSEVTNMGSMFFCCRNLSSIDVSSLDTSSVTAMGSMFSSCESLEELDLSNFDTSSVTSMVYMFSNCTNLTDLDISNFDTSSVDDMCAMFSNCTSLENIDVSSFDTSSVTKCNMMFINCTELTSLDLSSFNTSSVTNMSEMFGSCGNLTTIYATNSFTTTSVTSSTAMFRYCNQIVGGMGTVYDENHIEKEYAHIDGGTSNKGYFTDGASREITLVAGNSEAINLGVNAQGFKIQTAPNSNYATCSIEGNSLIVQSTEGVGNGTTSAIVSRVGSSRTINVTINVQKANYKALSGYPAFHTNLQSAIDAVQEGGTITVLDNTTETTAASINKNLTIDVNGKTLTRSATITSTNATTTITGTGTIDCTAEVCLIDVKGTGGLTTSGSLLLRSVGDVINGYDTNTINLNNTNITSTRNVPFATRNNSSCTVTMTDCNVFVTHKNKVAIGFYNSNGSGRNTGSLTLAGNTRVGNGATNTNGSTADGTDPVSAITWWSSSSITIKDTAGVMAGPYSGDAISLHKACNVTCSDSSCVFACNSTGKRCFNIEVAGCTININSDRWFYATAQYVASMGTFGGTYNITCGQLGSKQDKYMFYMRGAASDSPVGNSSGTREFRYMNSYNTTTGVSYTGVYYVSTGRKITADPTSVRLIPGQTKTVTLGGLDIGTLSIKTQSNSTYATASLSGNTLTVTGVKYGSTSVVIQESNGNKELNIPIYVDYANYEVSSVASGKDKYHETLASAIDASNSGATIKVLRNNTDSSDATIDGKNLTLNTNGKTLTRTKTIKVNSGNTLTLSGSGTLKTTSQIDLITNDGTLAIAHTGTISNTSTGRNHTIYNTGTVNKTGSGTISSSTTGKTIMNGTVSVSAGTVSSTGGVAIYSTGDFTMSGGTVSSTADCAVYATGSNVTVTGGTIRETDTTVGAAFQYSGTGTATITGGTIQSSSGIGVKSTIGTLTIGNDDGTVNITPSITGGTYGVQTASGQFYFYDGTITGETNKSIYKNPTDKPLGYGVNKTTSGSTETATLVLQGTGTPGTESNPYKIYKIEDIVRISNRNNSGNDFNGKYVELMTSLDFNSNSSYESYSRTDFGDINENGTVETLKTELTTEKGYKPIGTGAIFKAIFNGNNNTIGHLHVDRNANFGGFIGNSYSIKNLTVKDGYVKGLSATGGIVGALRSGTIENCHNDNTTVVLGEGSCMYVGGVVGQLVSGTIGIDNCTNSGNISAYGTYLYNGTYIQACGGILGLSSDGTSITNCSNYGTITGYNNGTGIGGICGSGNTNITLSNCYNGSAISGNTRVGGIMGNTNSLTISNCYNKGTVSASDAKVGSIIGHKANSQTYSHLYYLSSLGLGAIQGNDYSEYNVGGTTNNFSSLSDFLAWLTTQ